MARALDAGPGDAFTGRPSELRGKETDPQPDRVGFKQAAYTGESPRALSEQFLTSDTRLSEISSYLIRISGHAIGCLFVLGSLKTHAYHL